MENEKRLTEKHYDGTGYYMKCSEECHLVDLSCEDCVKMGNLVDRLGEYEDKAEQSVDAVEVVRCKDCKHYKPQNQGTHRACTTPYCMRVVAAKVSADDFCSYGERKDNDNN